MPSHGIHRLFFTAIPRRRTRIKQKFRTTGPLPSPWFPPKWGLNEKIAETARQLAPRGASHPAVAEEPVIQSAFEF